MKFATLALWACTAVAVLLPIAAPAAEAQPIVNVSAEVIKGRQIIDGVDYYYEIRGKGEPMLLLHGGLGSIEMFAPLMPKLSEHRQVIAVDLHGHGRTPLGQRPFSCESGGDDMAALVGKLGHQQVDVLGYSLGSCVALRMAIQRPASVRRLVLVSGAYSDEGYYPGIRAQQSENIRREIWFKLWGNATINPLSALTRATADKLIADPHIRAFMNEGMEELAAVGAAIGCPIAESAEDRMAVTARRGAFKTSMLQDVVAGRPIELEALLGAPREIARRAGIATPQLDRLYAETRLLGESLKLL